MPDILDIIFPGTDDENEAMTQPTQAQIEALKAFARWAIREGTWEIHDLNGGEIQDKAAKLGLIVETQYDPEKHGESEFDVPPGDPWYVFAPFLGE